MSSMFTRRAAALAALLLAAAGAQAASVTCQSRDNRREDCRLRGDGDVVMVRQISNTKCVKGRNWDETRGGIYVTNGCGGVFETRGGWNDRPGQGGGWTDRPGQGGGWNDRPGQDGGRPRPGHGGNSPLSNAESVCMTQPPEGEAGDGRIERSTRLGSGDWEFTVRYPSGRFRCIVNRQGQLRAYEPMR